MHRPKLFHSAAMIALCSAALPACANYPDELARAEQHYQNARYEAALVNLEDLEPHLGGLSRAERVRYEVARGMTHLRLNQRPQARHWLALAREEAAIEPNTLSNSASATIEHAIQDLDPETAR